MTKHTFTPQQIKMLLMATKGRFFSVTFLKRTDGTKRKMIARLMPFKGGLAYDADEKNLLVVRDMQVGDYRSIPLDNVLTFKCGNVSF